MINIRTSDEIAIIRNSALMVSATLAEIAAILRVGMPTLEIDKFADTYIRDNGGVPSFKGYKKFPYSVCISVNEVVVHGFPSAYELKDGDIVSIDCGVYKNGYHGDSAYTFAIGNVKPETLKLMRITKESLYRGIAKTSENNRIGDIGYAIEHCCYGENGYGVVKDLVGHGVGKALHEDPHVPNHGKRGDGKKMKMGMVFAIEPMVNQGKRDVKTLKDGWTVVTADGKPSVHFEHTTAIGKLRGEPLSDFTPIEAAERANPELNIGYFPV